METKTNVEKVINDLLEALVNHSPESKEYKEIVDRITALSEVSNKDKVTTMSETNDQFDRELKKKELKETRVWNVVKTGVEVTAIVLPVAFYGIWMKRGLEFEKEGCYTSGTFKGLLSKFKPTK